MSPYIHAKAVVLGCGGTTLTDPERAFFTQKNPLGFILFARNLDTPIQVRQLVQDLRACVTHPDCPILIDQEGGRVSRLPRTHWPVFPPLECYGNLYAQCPEHARRAVYLAHRLIAYQLYDLGITVNCAPMLDIITSQTDWIIGERAFGDNPHVIAELGQIAADALWAGGIIPITKHLPGHGRARCDSHFALPVVHESQDILERTDFYPFTQVQAPLGMIAHILYPALDPDRVATHSKRILQDLIRKDMGFQGMLISDDLSMGALSGTLQERTALAFTAGIDIALHCSGRLEEMAQVCAACPLLSMEQANQWEELSQHKPRGVPCPQEWERELLDLVRGDVSRSFSF